MNIPFSPERDINLRQRSLKFQKKIKIKSKRIIDNKKNSDLKKIKRKLLN